MSKKNKRKAAATEAAASKYYSKPFNVFAIFWVSILALISALPFLLVLSGSFTDNTAILTYGYQLIPPQFSLEAYRIVFRAPEVLLRAYGVTIFITVVGTVTSVFLTSMAAYVLHRKDFKHRNIFALIFFFTTIFSGGLVPFFLLYTSLGLQNNILALIFPHLIGFINIVIMRTFFTSLPAAIGESGKIDGANDFTIYFRLYLPMAIPGLATIGLFTALAYWNEWYNAMLFISDERLYPLQYLLHRILNAARFATTLAQRTGTTMAAMPTESLKLAMLMVTIGPVVFLFPFIQRFFIRGLTIGAVKG